MAETRKLQYGIRLPDGTVHDINGVTPGREQSVAVSSRSMIRSMIADAKKMFGVTDDYQPELVHRFVITTDWVTGEFDPELELDTE